MIFNHFKLTTQNLAAALASMSVVSLAAAGLISPSCLQVDPTRLIFTMLAACFAATWRVRVCGESGGSFSASPAIILAAVPFSGAFELALVSIAASLMQRLWGADVEPAGRQLVFNASVAVLSSSAASACFHIWSANYSLALIMAAVAFYTVDTMLVAFYLSRVSGLGFPSAWQRWYFCSVPYYLSFVATATLAMAVAEHLHLPPGLVLIPSVYVCYHILRLWNWQAAEAA